MLLYIDPFAMMLAKMREVELDNEAEDGASRRCQNRLELLSLTSVR